MQRAKSRKVRRSREAGGVHWNLRLYIAGNTPKSLDALRHLKQIC